MVRQTQPELSEDAKVLIDTLVRHKVEFLIIGGWAVIAHGYARLTQDIDFYYRRSLENSTRLFEALTDFFGVRPPGIAGPDDLLAGDGAQFGEKPNRVDFLNTIPGVDFDKAYSSREKFPFFDNCFYISIDDLIKNKLAVARKRDLADADQLEKIRERRKTKRKSPGKTNSRRR